MDYVQPSNCSPELTGNSSAPSQDRNAPSGGASTQQHTNGDEVQSTPVETSVQKNSKHLDDKLVAREQDNLSRMQAKFTEYNTKVHCLSRDSLP